MEGIQSKKLIIVVICLAAAVAVTLMFNNPFSGRGDEGRARESLQMLCVNENCGKAFELSVKDFQDEMDEMGPAIMMPLAQPSIKCPECGEKSAFVAFKCKKCGEVFIPDRMSQEDPEKCPECGYSEYEEEYGEE